MSSAQENESSKNVELERTFSIEKIPTDGSTSSEGSTAGTASTASTDSTAKIRQSIEELDRCLNDSNRGVKSPNQEKQVPVFHTFLIKGIKDSDAGPQLIGTFVQRVFGIPPPEDPEKKPYFEYRFNECSAKNEMVDIRKTEYGLAKCTKVPDISYPPAPQDTTVGADNLWSFYEREDTEVDPVESSSIQGPCGSDELDTLGKNEEGMVNFSRHTFQIKAPLELDVELDCFPFTVTRATVDVEMSSREDYRKKNLQLRPTCLLHNVERRNNICIQELRKNKKGSEKRCMHPFTGCEYGQTTEHKLKLKLDGLDDFAMVSPYPEISYHYDSKKNYCPRFSVTFWLVEEGMPKFIRIILPMILICAMTTVNVINDFVAWRDDTDESATEGADRYLNNAATFALTAVFILPGIAPSRNNSNIICWNDMYVFLVFTALTLSSLPPQLIGFPHLGFAGMVVFWLSFAIPIANGVWYGRFIRQIKRERRDVVQSQKKEKAGNPLHPFLKDNSYNEWKPNAKSAVVDENCTFVGDIVERAKKIMAEEGEEDWQEGEEVQIDYTNTGIKYTVSKASDKTFLVSY